jgi:acetyl-CoA synthetase
MNKVFLIRNLWTKILLKWSEIIWRLNLMANDALENLSFESRIYEPTKEFAAKANARESMYAEAKDDRLKFWEKQAHRLTWGTPWTKTLDWSNAPLAKWFIDGKLNVSYNCVDRHVEQ